MKVYCPITLRGRERETPGYFIFLVQVRQQRVRCVSAVSFLLFISNYFANAILKNLKNIDHASIQKRIPPIFVLKRSETSESRSAWYSDAKGHHSFREVQKVRLCPLHGHARQFFVGLCGLQLGSPASSTCFTASTIPPAWNIHGYM